jgi:gas vesicle protein
MNDWLKTLAPLLGTALGGPLGGAAAAFLADKLGIESKTVEAVTEVLNSGKMSPEQIASIKLAELDFKKFTETNKIDVMRLEAGDRDSARKMQIATQSKMPAVITIMVTIGFFGVLTALLLMPDLKANEIVLVMVGQLSAVWGACVAFYVSTTYSSANKNQLLANSAPAK